MRARRSILALGLLAVLVTTRARAGASAVEQARTQFNAGAQAYSAARYDVAVIAFEEAYRLAPRREILFSLAQAERKQYFAAKNPEFLRHAIAHYRQYLDEMKSGGRRADAVDALAELEPLATKLDPVSVPAAAAESKKAKLTLYSPTEGAHVFLDGAAAGDAPFIGELEPGKHRVKLIADGYFDEEREIVAEAGGRETLDLRLRERPSLLSIGVDRSCEVFVDARSMGTAPFRRPIEVSSGAHVVTIAANGRKAYSRDVVLERGKPATVNAELETSGQRVVSVALLATGGVALLSAGAFAGVAVYQEGRAQDVLDTRAHTNIAPSELHDYTASAQRRDDWRLASIVTAGGGVALLGAGALLYLFDRPQIGALPTRPAEAPDKPRRPEVEVVGAPLVSPGELGWQMVGRF